MFPSMPRHVPHIEEKILSYMGPRDLTLSKSVCMEWWYVIVKKKEEEGPLIRAARMGLENLVDFILSEKSVNVNEVLPSKSPMCCTALCLNEAYCKEAKAKGYTALMLAAANGHNRIVERLLLRGDIDVNTSSKRRKTALIIATQKGHEEVVRLLLKRDDIDVNIAFRPKNKGIKGCIICKGHICFPQYAKLKGLTALMLAAKSGHYGIVKRLLRRDDIDVNAADEDGQTALMLAAQEGHGIIVLMLMNRDDIFGNAEDKWCNTASEMASNYQVQWHIATEDELIMKLILCGDDDFVNTIVDGRNALMVAVIRGFALAVRLLLKNGAIDVNATDRSGQTALIMAAERGHYVIVKQLLKREDIDVNAVDQYGTFALLMGAQLGHDEVVDLLLKRGDISPNTADKIGRTPLMYAAMHGHAFIAEQLLDHPDINLELQDSNGKCALTHARDAWGGGGDKRGKEEIVSMLKSRGMVVGMSPFDTIWMAESETVGVNMALAEEEALLSLLQ